MKPFIKLLIPLALNLTYLMFIIWLGYRVWIDGFPILETVALIFLLWNWPRVLRAFSGYSVKEDRRPIDLAYQNAAIQQITPDFIFEVLCNPGVIQVIKNDLLKTGQIGYQEMWRLGLITPDLDWFDPNSDPAALKERTAKFVSDRNYRYKWTEQIPLKRAAVLFNRTSFNVQANSLFVSGGAIRPTISASPGWSYGLSTKLNRGESIDIRNLQLTDYSATTTHRSRSLPEFLREDGFPLKPYYPDGDPLTADRGGTIVLDKGSLKVIYPSYLVQRRLIDDEGNLVDLGMDENFDNGVLVEVKMRPSVSRRLIQMVARQGYTPVVRYRSVPYASDFMLPVLDTPMSASGWADLYVDTCGKAKLFIAKDNTEAQWVEMMEKLRQLFFEQLARKDYHLLGLTKDRALMNEYLWRKQSILSEYFILQDWVW